MDDGRPRHDLNSVTQAEIKRSMLYLEKGSIHYDYAATRVYLAHCSCETILCSWLTSRTVWWEVDKISGTFPQTLKVKPLSWIFSWHFFSSSESVLTRSLFSASVCSSAAQWQTLTSRRLITERPRRWACMYIMCEDIQRFNPLV